MKSWREPTFENFSKKYRDENGRSIFIGGEKKLKEVYELHIKRNRIEKFWIKIKDLYEKGYKIEAFLLSSQVVETSIKNNILLSEKIIHNNIKRKSNVKSPRFFERDFNNLTLGRLVDTLALYLRSKKIIRKLKIYLKYRNLTTHNLLSPDVVISKKLETVNAYLNRGTFFIIIFQLQILHLKLEKELYESNIGIDVFNLFRYKNYIPEKFLKDDESKIIVRGFVSNRPPGGMKFNNYIKEI